MSSKFGFLSKINFLQDFASIIIAGLNPASVHNLEKYMAIKKVHYLSAIEDIEGDYFSYKGSKAHGVARAFSEFLEQGKLTVRHVLNYGMGGAAFVISGVK